MLAESKLIKRLFACKLEFDPEITCDHHSKSHVIKLLMCQLSNDQF